VLNRSSKGQRRICVSWLGYKILFSITYQKNKNKFAARCERFHYSKVFGKFQLLNLFSSKGKLLQLTVAARRKAVYEVSKMMNSCEA
jgi:hypothetical protein